ncbi:hypothetical protein AB0O20_06280 [Streptomyces kronopolitis]
MRDETDNDLLDELPTIQIQQIPGGSEDGVRLARFIVDIDVYAASRAEAIDLGRAVHDWATRELRGNASERAQIGRVGTLSLPAPRPYENTGLRRVGATYEIYCHPVS